MLQVSQAVSIVTSVLIVTEVPSPNSSESEVAAWMAEFQDGVLKDNPVFAGMDGKVLSSFPEEGFVEALGPIHGKAVYRCLHPSSEGEGKQSKDKLLIVFSNRD